MKTIQDLREAYEAWREMARNAGFAGNFKDACKALLRQRGIDPRKATPKQWTEAAKDIYYDRAAANAEENLMDLDDYEPSYEPYEVRGGPFNSFFDC